MKALSISLILFSLCLVSMAQDDLYFSSQKTKKDTLTIKTDLQYTKYCLEKYYKERQIAWALSGISAITGTGLIICIKSDNRPAIIGTSIAIAASSICSYVVFIDSDKWLRKASIVISAGRIEINF